MSRCRAEIVVTVNPLAATPEKSRERVNSLGKDIDLAAMEIPGRAGSVDAGALPVEWRGNKQDRATLQNAMNPLSGRLFAMGGHFIFLRIGGIQDSSGKRRPLFFLPVPLSPCRRIRGGARDGAK